MSEVWTDVWKDIHNPAQREINQATADLPGMWIQMDNGRNAD